ncbi:MAG: permease [Oscillospiraceae bacterium]|nr:permease [Oscillospiraceae bacterium]
MEYIKNIGVFIQEQLLGMKWLNNIIKNLLEIIGINLETWYGGILEFFIFDTIKIFILLFFTVGLIFYIQSYFPPERTNKILGRFTGIRGNIISALLGTITPFCSCSSIPIFMGFTKSGLPIGMTFSFLISSPLVDLGSLVLLTSIFGWNIAILYVILGLVLAVIGGAFIQKFGMEKYIQDFNKKEINIYKQKTEITQKDRIKYALSEIKNALKKVTPYILIGVGIGAFIYNIIPVDFIENILGKENIFSVIIATIVGVPIYTDIFGAIPVAESLLIKGAGLGTVLSFMMAVTALSIPSIIMLKKVMKPKLLTTFIGIVVLGIIAIGYIFNGIQFLFI